MGGETRPHPASCRILAPQPGIEPGSKAVKVPSRNHWTAREFSKGSSSIVKAIRNFKPRNDMI